MSMAINPVKKIPSRPNLTERIRRYHLIAATGLFYHWRAHRHIEATQEYMTRNIFDVAAAHPALTDRWKKSSLA